MARAALPRGLNAYSGVGELERIEIRRFRQSMDRRRVALERRQPEWTTAVNRTGEAKQSRAALLPVRPLRSLGPPPAKGGYGLRSSRHLPARPAPGALLAVAQQVGANSRRWWRNIATSAPE